MKTNLATLLLIGASAFRVNATVLLDDTFADGNRTTQNLPSDSAWFFSSASAVATTTGAMTVTTPSGAIMGVTYFTTNSSSAPVSLNVGDMLTATIWFTFNGLASPNTSGGFRIGLFDFADSTLSPKHVSADLSSNNGQGNGVAGYALFQDMGTGFNNSNPMKLEKRTTISDSGLLGTSGDWTLETSGPGSTTGFAGFTNGVQYTLQLSVKRTNSTSLVFTTTWVNAGNAATLSTSWTDTAASTFNFDGISLRPSGSSSTATTIAFNEVKVEVASGSAPSSVDIDPVDQTVVVGQDANFHVLASGTAPLTYQWFFNTNTPVTDATNSSLTISNAQLTNAGAYFAVVSNPVDVATSGVAFLTVNEPEPASIVTQPQNLTVLPGETASFSVVVSGTPPLSYQWFYNTNAVITNATDDTLVITNAQISNAGTYSVVVSNIVDLVTSTFAVLSINTNPVGPAFSTEPASLVVLAGGIASFNAIVTGTAPIYYQWSKDSVPIAGATTATLTLTNVQLSNAGSYTLTASNSVSLITSSPVTLTVTPTVSVPFSSYNLVGFAQGTTGGGVLADTDPNYAKVYTATDLANALNSKTVKAIEIMTNLDLGYNEIEASAKAASEPFRAHNPPQLHPRLLVTGVSLIDIQKKSGLTIFSANGATIRHACFNIKSAGNVIVRNLKFDELWEWDEATKGNYDKNDWDFIDLGNGGTVSNIWIDHCTFTKTYDGIVDIKQGSFNITFSWNRYVGDDGATNTNSFVRQQINALEANRSAYTMYNFLRANGFSAEDIVTICQGHDKTHLVGATTASINAQHTLTFHHQWYANPWDRLPRLRGGNVHNFNIFVDDRLGLAARRLRDARAAAMSSSTQVTLNNTYNFKPFLNGTISTESGAILVEKSVYIDCLTPLRNNQTDPSDPTYTGKIIALDTIYQMDNADGSTTLVRGNSTDPGNPLGPFQAPTIAFSWNLPGNQLPYTCTMDDPSQVQAIVTSPTAGAGAGVLAWAKTNWLKTSYPLTPPSIIADPQSRSLQPGDTAVFVAAAAGSAPLAYQWYFNTNSLLVGETNTALVLPNIGVTNAGTYLVVVTNSVGSATSAVATLTVTSISGFAAWQTQQFTAQQLSDPNVSGPGASPAGDGIANFVKYALGLLPFVPVTHPLVSIGVNVSGDAVFSYHRPASITDVIYDVVVSTDLTSWSDSGVSQSMVGTDSDGLQIWEARYTGSATTTRFFRLTLQ